MNITPDPTAPGVYTITATPEPTPVNAVLPGWAPGVGVPQVIVSDPQQTLQLVTSTETLSDYTVTIREVGA